LLLFIAHFGIIATILEFRRRNRCVFK